MTSDGRVIVPTPNHRDRERAPRAAPGRRRAEDDDSGRLLRDREMSRHRHRPGHNFDLLIAERRIGGAATGEDVPKSPGGSIEQSDYLVVGGLSEVAVALPDGEKELRG